MKYFKVYKSAVTRPVGHVWYDLTAAEFNAEIAEAAAEIAPYFEDATGNPDYDANDYEISKAAEQLDADARSERGADCGEFRLYIRDDDVVKFDIDRPWN